jgi:ABC-type proline/glycine betaine transport system substrate-binding protein
MPSAKDSPLYNEKGCYYAVEAAEDPQWLEHSDIHCAKPEINVYVGHSAALAKRAPEIGKFLKQVYVTPDLVNSWILRISKDKMEAADVAKEWVEANADFIEKEWLANVSY